jgi:hypothetical protein
MRRVGLLAVVLVTTATSVAAQGVSLNRTGSGARAAGMGNAFIAVSDDGTAASWNPAGLAQLREAELSLVHSTSRRKQSFAGYRTFDGSSAFTSLAAGSPGADIEFASAAVPFRLGAKPVTVQIGWRRLYDLGTQVDGNVRRVPVGPTARPESTLRVDSVSDGSVKLWSIAGAVGLTNRLSAGWSLDVYRSGWEERRNWSELPGILGPPDFLSLTQTNELRGHALNLGLLLAYPTVSVGLVYHGAMRADFPQSLSLRSTLIDPIDQSSDSHLQFPRSIGLGVAWRARPLLRLAVDVNHNQWTQFLVSGSSDFEGAVNFIDELPLDLSATRDTVSLNVGIERLFPTRGLFVPLRLGAAYEPQGGRDPLLRDDLDYYVLAAGTGVNTNSFKFDVALEYLTGSVRNSENFSLVYVTGRALDFGLPPAPEAAGRLGFQQWRLKVSMIYRLTNTDGLKDVLKKALGT